MDLLRNPTIQLLYEYTNNAGGHVYLDHKNNYGVRISKGQDLMSPPQCTQVIDHGDHYMDPEGFKLLKTSCSHNMDSWGNLPVGSWALSEPPWAPQRHAPRAHQVPEPRAEPVPSVPPIFPAYGPQIPMPRKLTVKQVLESSNPFLITNTQGKSVLTKIPLTRIYTNQVVDILYEDPQQDLHKTI